MNLPHRLTRPQFSFMISYGRGETRTAMQRREEARERYRPSLLSTVRYHKRRLGTSQPHSYLSSGPRHCYNLFCFVFVFGLLLLWF